MVILRALPDLNDDVLTEILLRFPPDEPDCLVRASAVAKRWRDIITGLPFLRRFRQFHRSSMLLGFFREIADKGSIQPFVPTALTSPFTPDFQFGPWVVEDSRHGLVLLQGPGGSLAVWNPSLCELKKVPDFALPAATQVSSVLVLCGANGCDHLNCNTRGFCFRVVRVYQDDGSDGGIARVCLYMSDAGAWGMPFAIGEAGYQISPHVLLSGDHLHILVEQTWIVRVDLQTRISSKFDLPQDYGLSIGMPTSLLMVPVKVGCCGLIVSAGQSLEFWSYVRAADGAIGWFLNKVIHLEKMLPQNIGYLPVLPDIYVEGADVLYLAVGHRSFIFSVRTGLLNEVSHEANRFGSIVPCISTKSGGFKVKDLENVLKLLGLNPTDHQASAMVSDSEYTDFPEFLVFMTHTGKQFKEKDLRDAVQVWDSHLSGMISPNLLRQIVNEMAGISVLVKWMLPWKPPLEMMLGMSIIRKLLRTYFLSHLMVHSRYGLH